MHRTLYRHLLAHIQIVYTSRKSKRESNYTIIPQLWSCGKTNLVRFKFISATSRASSDECVSPSYIKVLVESKNHPEKDMFFVVAFLTCDKNRQILKLFLVMFLLFNDEQPWAVCGCLVLSVHFSVRFSIRTLPLLNEL